MYMSLVRYLLTLSYVLAGPIHQGLLQPGTKPGDLFSALNATSPEDEGRLTLKQIKDKSQPGVRTSITQTLEWKQSLGYKAKRVLCILSGLAIEKILPYLELVWISELKTTSTSVPSQQCSTVVWDVEAILLHRFLRPHIKNNATSVLSFSLVI